MASHDFSLFREADQALERLSTQVVESTYKMEQLHFESQEIKIQKLQLELQDLFQHLEQSLEQGWITLLNELKNRDEITFLHILAKKDSLNQILNEPVRPARHENGWNLLDLSQEQLESLYHIAYSFYETNQLQEASESFLVLISLSSLDYRFWLGAGFVLQAQQDNESALTCLVIATTLQSKLSIAYLAIAECLIELNQKEEADSYLELAIEDQSNKDSVFMQTYQTLKERSQQIS